MHLDILLTFFTFSNSVKEKRERRKRKKFKKGIKALHSELLTELLGRFPSRNEYFIISEVRIGRHFFKVFGKFGISKFPKLPKLPNVRKNQFPKFPKFFRNFQSFSKLFSELFRTFWPKNRVFCPKTSNITSFFKIFEIYVHFWIITELFSELKLPKIFRGNFRTSEIPVITEKFPNFENRTFPKLAKTKSSEISV